MTRKATVLLALLALSARGAPARAADARPFAERHPTVSRRNIFDPERGRSRTSADPSRSATPPPAPPRRESLQLLGVALTDRDAYAHFAGAGAPAVARPGEPVGPLRLAEIRDGSVTLEADGQRWELPVGHQITRVGSGPWSVAAGAAPAAPSAVPAAAAALPVAPGASGAPAAAPVAPSGAGDILRRLMERRMREMGQ